MSRKNLKTCILAQSKHPVPSKIRTVNLEGSLPMWQEAGKQIKLACIAPSVVQIV